jgi:hypothetical protein
MQNLAISLGVMQRISLAFFNQLFFLMTVSYPSRPKDSIRQPRGPQLCPDSIRREPDHRSCRVLLHVYQGTTIFSPADTSSHAPRQIKAKNDQTMLKYGAQLTLDTLFLEL